MYTLAPFTDASARRARSGCLVAHLLSMRLNRRSLSPMMKNERKSYFSLTGVRTPVNASSRKALGTRSTCGQRQNTTTYDACVALHPSASELLTESVNALAAGRRALSTNDLFPCLVQSELAQELERILRQRKMTSTEINKIRDRAATRPSNTCRAWKSTAQDIQRAP